MSLKFHRGMRVGLSQNNKPEGTGFPESQPSELWDATGMTGDFSESQFASFSRNTLNTRAQIRQCQRERNVYQ